MKLLRLSSSNDILPGFTTNRPGLFAEMLEKELGQPVELVLKPIWPNAGYPDAVAKWLEREKPDIVWVSLIHFWFNYPSVPLRMERLLGPFGKLVSRGGFKVADTGWLAHNRVFRAGQRVMKRVIGGDTHFTPDEVVACVEQVARRVLREEGVVLAIQGPNGHTNFAVSKKQAKEHEQRFAYVVRRLRALSETLHFEYEATSEIGWLNEAEPELGHDLFHYTPEFGAQRAGYEFAVLRRAIERQRPDLLTP